jgi:hypothetical protein
MIKILQSAQSGESAYLCRITGAVKVRICRAPLVCASGITSCDLFVDELIAAADEHLSVCCPVAGWPFA